MTPRKVAILGGGLGALTAAFELTEQPDYRNKYDITVYQVGWRLGGKAASGRRRAAEFGSRTEEHGIHVFFGFYENAFFLMRRCYAALRRAPGVPLSTWYTAFLPQNYVAWAERQPDPKRGAPRWCFWGVNYPKRKGLPGDLAEALRTPPRNRRRRVKQASNHELMFRWLKVAFEQLYDTHFGPPLWMRAAMLLLSMLVIVLRGIGVRPPLKLLRKLVNRHHRHMNYLNNPGARHLWYELRLGMVVMDGLLRDGVLEKGFDELDHIELQEWLSRHGADKDLLGAPLIQSGYDAVFAFAKTRDSGGQLVPAIAAGTAVRSMLRAFDYRGAAVWKMGAGMGDAVVMPLYQVLKERGVKFKFFHRVSELEVSASGDEIQRIRVVPQLALAAGNGDYKPEITDANNLPCWPNEPLFDQLSDGDDVRSALQTNPFGLECPSWLSRFELPEVSLERDRDFDDVILGISAGGLAEITQRLAERSKPWRCMLANVTTVATQAFQLWFEQPLGKLGWNTDEFPNPIVTGLKEPIDTWIDMTHALRNEDSGRRPVKALAYFCGPYFGPHEHDPVQATAHVRKQGGAFVQRDLPVVWDGPNLVTSLVAPVGSTDAQRLDAQHWRANVTGTERYVQSTPGSISHRLPSDNSGFTNLALAGDWTLNGMNVGCAESAIMSGMQAARAVTRHDPLRREITVWAESDVV
jgi:uncharacterized protein with NAD-binding domain and iron-sulfur cluster